MIASASSRNQILISYLFFRGLRSVLSPSFASNYVGGIRSKRAMPGKIFAIPLRVAHATRSPLPNTRVRWPTPWFPHNGSHAVKAIS